MSSYVTEPLSEEDPAAEPVFTAFTVYGLWCPTCGGNVSFRTLTQLDATEVYLCNTCDTEVGQKRTTVPRANNRRHAPDDVPLTAQPSSGDEDAYDEGVIV